MLYDFVTVYRDAIIARAKEKLTARPWPQATARELDNGVPLFLSQLADVLRDEEAGRAYAPTAPPARATAAICWRSASRSRRSCTTTATSARRSPSWRWSRTRRSRPRSSAR